MRSWRLFRFRFSRTTSVGLVDEERLRAARGMRAYGSWLHDAFPIHLTLSEQDQRYESRHGSAH